MQPQETTTNGAATNGATAPDTADTATTPATAPAKPKRTYTKKSLAERTANAITDGIDGIKASIETAEAWAKESKDKDTAAILASAVDQCKSALALLVGVADVLRDSAPASASVVNYEVGTLVRVCAKDLAVIAKRVMLAESDLGDLTIVIVDRPWMLVKTGGGDRFKVRVSEIQPIDAPSTATTPTN